MRRSSTGGGGKRASGGRRKESTGRRRHSSVTSGLPKTYKLEKMLMAPNHILLNTIIDLNPNDLADDLVNIFEYNRRGVNLLKYLVERHTANVKDAHGLLRINDITTKVVGSLSSLFGQQYLQTVLGPLTRDVIIDPSVYYMDPVTQGPDTLNEHARNLVLLCQRFFDAIIRSHTQLPRTLCEISQFLHESALKRFPDEIDASNFQVVGGFLFLRFLCPAIVSPQLTGLVDEGTISDEAKQVFINVAKALMNLANNSMNKRLNDRQPHLALLNQFVEDNTAPLHKYFQQVVSTADQHTDPQLTLTELDKLQSLNHLHYYVYHHMADVERVMGGYFAQGESSREGAGEGAQRRARVANPFDSLKAVIEELGKPSARLHRRKRSIIMGWLGIEHHGSAAAP